MRIHRLLLTYNYSNRIQIVKDFSMTKLSVALEVWSLYELTKPQMEKFESQFFTISSQQIFERTLDCNWDLNSLRRAIERELGVKDDGHASSPRSSQESQEFIPTANFVARSSHKKTNKPETSVKKCLLCIGNHSPTTCHIIQNYDAKISIIKQKKVCFNCFGKHKVVSEIQ